MLWRGRVSSFLLFGLAGAAIGTWTARIPAVKADLGLGDGLLGVALVGFVAGAITGMQLVGRLVDRHGSTRVLAPVALAEGLVLVLPGLAVNLWTLTLALFVFGVNHGMINIAMNAQAVAVEEAAGRRLMSRFHATYTIGGFAGAAIGGLSAFAGLSALSTFLTVGALVVAVGWWAGRWSWRVDPAPAQSGGPAAAPLAGVLFLGALAFGGLVGEGAAADWSTVYLRESLGSSAGFAAAAYAAFCVMMTAGRLVGDSAAARFGPVALVRACGLLAATGLGLALAVGEPVAGVVGFGLFGAGLSCIAPQVFAAAGRHNPAVAGRAIARVASLGYLGFFTGPIMIGIAAELVGLPRALIIAVLLSLFVALAAPALRGARTGSELTSSSEGDTIVAR